MFENNMATNFYKLHYQEAIGPCLTNEAKLAVANRISGLTLKAPIWNDRETNWIADFLELQPFVSTKLTGLYLCTIFAAIVDEFRYPKDDPMPWEVLRSIENPDDPEEVLGLEPDDEWA